MALLRTLVGTTFALGTLVAQTQGQPPTARLEEGIAYELAGAMAKGVELKAPPLTIQFHSGSVLSGYVGGSRFFGDVDVLAGGTVRWADSSGFALIPPGELPENGAAVLAVLRSTRRLRVEGEELTMESDEQAKLRFVRTPVAKILSRLVGVDLYLVRFVASGQAVSLPPRTAITLTFREEGRITGRGVINAYSGRIVIGADGGIELQMTLATLMAGPPELMQIETAYFDALSGVRQAAARPSGLVLTSEDRSTVLEFTTRVPQ